MSSSITASRAPDRVIFSSASLHHNFLRKYFPRWLSLCLFTILVLVSPNVQAAPPDPWQSKVDSWVLDRIGSGPVEFLVALDTKADLRQAARLETKTARGAFVYRQLSSAAAASQAPLLAELETFKKQGLPVEYRAYWIVNAIWVRGDISILKKLSVRPDVIHIYANPAVRLNLPEQPDWEVQPAFHRSNAVEWGLDLVGAPEVWASGYTGQGAVIGGQDTGYDWTHPALKEKYRGWDGSTASHDYHWYDAIHTGAGPCGADSPEPCDDNDHGTHTMGIMVGDDGAGNQVGMAPGARWIGCRNMYRGAGTPATYIECYQFFAAPTDRQGNNPRPELAPDVINNSWSCPVEEGCTDKGILLEAVQNVRAAGILTVHSTGNEGPLCETVGDPAAIYEESFSVGATTIADSIATYSSRGPVVIDGSLRRKPDVSAPGSGVRSSVPGGGYEMMSGTSMAAPHVTGLAALLISARPDLKGQVDTLETIIEQTAAAKTTNEVCGELPGNQIPNNTYGWGRIDALAAIRSVEPPTLEITKTVDLPGYQPSQVFTYTLSVVRSHPDAVLHSIIITDALPAQTILVSASPTYTLQGEAVVWNILEWPANQPLTLTLAVQAQDNASGSITNQAYTVDSSETEPSFGLPVTLHRIWKYWLPFVYKPPE